MLRLARLINYNAKRNLPATGMLKIDSISTSQDVRDSTGTNLANSTVVWNDSANANYREQFTAILNAANQTGQLFGNPRESGKIGGITTEVYTLNSNQLDLPIFKFQKSVGGITRQFEIVPRNNGHARSRSPMHTCLCILDGLTVNSPAIGN